MSVLADIIEQNSEAILESWTRAVESALAPGSPTKLEVRDHIPLFLKELVAVLRRGAAPATSAAGQEHGRQRYHLGFDLPALVREYGLLSGVILELAERRDQAVSPGEVRVFNAFITSAIAEGVTEHARQRARAEQDAEHRHSAELSAREASFAPLLHSLGDAVISTDPRTRDVSARRAADEFLARQARHTGLVADVSQALARTSDMRAMLQRCAQALVARLDAAAAQVWLLEATAETLVLHASAGIATPLEGAHGRVPVGPSPMGRIVQERRPQLIHPVGGDPRVVDPEWARREGLATFAGYPLLLGEKLVGVLTLFARHDLPADTLDTLRHVAETLALGVERVEAEAAKAALLARLEDALAVAGTGTWELDLATNSITADSRFREMFGLTAEEPFDVARGFALVPAEDRERVAALLEGAIAGRDQGRYEADHRIVTRADGRIRWVAARGQVTFDASGRALSFLGTSTDITARKEVEAQREETLQRTRAESERQRLMFEQAPAVIALLEGPEHRFRVANARYIQLVGGRQVLGRTVAEALPEVVEQGFITLLDTVRRTGEPHVGRETWLQLQRQPGGPLEDVCLDFVYQPIWDASGQTHSIFVHAVEVTDLVRSRETAQRAVRELETLTETLRVSEERLNLALDVVGAGIWELDMATQEVLADRRFRALFDLTPDESFALEKGLAIVHPEDRTRVAAAIADAIAGKHGGAYEADYRTVPRADGSYRWVAARGQVFLTPEGKARRFIGTGVDISERKQAEFARMSLLRSLAGQRVFGVAVLQGEELRFELANSVYRQMVGDRDMVGKPFLAALPEFVGQGADTGMLAVLHSGTPFSGRELSYHMVRHGAGDEPEERFFNFVWQPIFGPSGAVDSLLIITHDVTDQVRARRRVETLLDQLAASEERQKRMVAASGAGLWELEGATGRMTADARMVELMGLPPGTAFNLESGLDEVNPEDREPVARAVAAALAGEKGGHYLMLFRTGGRHGVPERWVESRAQRLVDTKGAVVLAGAMLDVTARKQAEAEREELVRREAAAHAEAEATRARLAKFVESAPAALGTVRGPHHVFEMVNPRYQELMGTHRPLLGRPMAEAAPEVVAQGFIQLFDTVYRTGEPFFAEGLPARLDRRGDGTLADVFFNLTFQPARGPQGQVEGVDVFGFEVTEQVLARQRAESLSHRLRESEERLRRVVEASGAGFWELDATTGRITADARVMTLLGLTPGAPLHLELALACVYAEDRERLAQAITTALSGEQGEQFLMTFRTAGLGNTPLRWVENRGQRRLNPQGQAVALAGALLDVTERKEAEEASRSLLRALGDSEERYRLATRATRDAIWDWNLVTGGMTWNEGLRELSGFSVTEARPDAAWWLELIHPEDRERVSQRLQAVIDASRHSGWSETYRFQRRDGSWARVEDRGWVTREASGRAVRMVGAMQDITARKEAEEILVRQSRHHALSAQVGLALTHNSSQHEMLQACAQSLVDQLGAAFARVWLLNPQHDVLELYASAGLYTHLDGPHGRVPVGKYKIGLIAQERQPHLTNHVLGDPRVGDQDWARREGMKAFAGYPLLVGDKLVGVVALFSRQLLASDTLDTLRLVADSIALGVERLRAEDELKTRADFEQKLIGIVSHDLRNPLNAILLGAAVLSQREVLDARATKSLLRIHSAADRAARMVKDLLDFTQARLGGGLKIEPKPMDLHEVTRGVVEEVEAAWPGRELEVEHEGAAQLTGDADRLGQVVQNLVTNALKYSPEDSPVRVVTRGRAEGVSLSIFNRGAPIPEDKLESIFEPMQRATAEVDKAGRSVGLGLYIVKSIVAAHGGRISVTSSEADGTVFTVSLPHRGAGPGVAGGH